MKTERPTLDLDELDEVFRVYKELEKLREKGVMHIWNSTRNVVLEEEAFINCFVGGCMDIKETICRTYYDGKLTKYPYEYSVEVEGIRFSCATDKPLEEI